MESVGNVTVNIANCTVFRTFLSFIFCGATSRVVAKILTEEDETMNNGSSELLQQINLGLKLSRRQKLSGK